MGVFWEYFKNTLRFPLIWSDGPLAVLVRGAAGGLDACRENVTWMRAHSMPDKCDAVFLNRIASGRGLTRWVGETDELWRFRTETAFRLHMVSGRRSCIQDVFAFAGITADLVEAGDAEKGWQVAGGKVLDGTWAVGVYPLDGNRCVDGSWALGDTAATVRPMTSVAGMMDLDWAEFGVVMDLGDAVALKDLARRIVLEFKPARSVPVWGYSLGFDLSCGATAGFAGEMRKEIDVTQSVGTAADSRMEKKTETPVKYVYAEIGEPLLRLDSGWVLGKNPAMIMAEGLSYKDFTVDGTWAVAEDNDLVLVEKVVTIIA